jgi:hypothetical protein
MRALLWYTTGEWQDVKPVGQFAQVDRLTMRLAPGGAVDVIHNPDNDPVPVVWYGTACPDYANTLRG